MKYIEDYIKFIGEEEFEESLTIEERMLFHLQLRDTVGYQKYKLRREWNIFKEELINSFKVRKRE